MRQWEEVHVFMFSHSVKAFEVEKMWVSYRGLSFPLLTNKHWDSQGCSASFWAKHKPCSSQEPAAVGDRVSQRHFLNALSAEVEWITSMQKILLRLLSILYSNVEKQACPFGVSISKDLSHLTPHGSPSPATARRENEAVPSPASNI